MADSVNDSLNVKVLRGEPTCSVGCSWKLPSNVGLLSLSLLGPEVGPFAMFVVPILVQLVQPQRFAGGDSPLNQTDPSSWDLHHRRS